MENYQVKISKNVQKQTFVKGLKSSKIVTEALTFGLKGKRKHLDKKLHVSIQKKKVGRKFNLEKIALCGLRWFKLNASSCQKDVKCQIVKHLDCGGGSEKK